MGNTVGPVWGEQVANILMQGQQMQQQERMQQEAQQQQAKMASLQIAVELLVKQAETGGEAGEAAMETLTQMTRPALEMAGVGEITAAQLGAVGGSIIQPEAEVAAATVGEDIRLKGAKTRIAETESMIAETEFANMEEKLNLMIDRGREEIELSKERRGLMGEQAQTLAAERELIPGQGTLQELRAAALRAETAKVESETYSPELNARAKEANINYLNRMAEQAQATAMKLKGSATGAQMDQILEVTKSLRQAMAEADNPDLALEFFTAHMIQLKDLGFELPLMPVGVEFKSGGGFITDWIAGGAWMFDENSRWLTNMYNTIGGETATTWELVLRSPGMDEMRKKMKEEGEKTGEKSVVVDPSDGAPDMNAAVFADKD